MAPCGERRVYFYALEQWESEVCGHTFRVSRATILLFAAAWMMTSNCCLPIFSFMASHIAAPIRCALSLITEVAAQADCIRLCHKKNRDLLLCHASAVIDISRHSQSPVPVHEVTMYLAGNIILVS